MGNKNKKPEGGAGKWLLTFNDMVTLLLTFFVLILSLSKLDASKLSEASRSVRSIFKLSEYGGKANVSIFTPFVIPMRDTELIFERDKRRLARDINEAAKTFGYSEYESPMDVKVIEEGVSVVLGEKLLSKTGMAEIEERNRPVLKILGSILQKTDCLIKVSGHTDNVLINNEQFPSNWELSTARAVNVVKYFISEGGILPERLSAAGYADSKPLLPNVSYHNRELNRRVEIILALKKE